MRVYLMAFAVISLASGASAEDGDFTTAIFVKSIHDALPRDVRYWHEADILRACA
jgi:hypothetical protein